MQPIRNNDTIGVWIGAIIGVLGILLVMMPEMTGMDMMKSGFGMMFIGFFVITLGLITAIVFGQRARQLNRILANEHILARWIYSEDQFRQQVEQAYTEQVSTNRSTFMIMLAWFIVIGGAFMGFSLLQDGEINGLFVGIFFGTLVLLGLVAFFAPILARQQALRASREVIIAHSGLVLDGTLHTWVKPLNKLAGVQYQTDAAGHNLLFEIHYLSRTSITATESYTVTVPVPTSHHLQAQKVVEYFNTHL